MENRRREGDPLVLSPECRMSLVEELFEQCSHSEQLNLLSRLSLCLKRDFLVTFPLELTERLLSYLDPKFVVRTCMMVRLSNCLLKCDYYHHKKRESERY